MNRKSNKPIEIRENMWKSMWGRNFSRLSELRVTFFEENRKKFSVGSISMICYGEWMKSVFISTWLSTSIKLDKLVISFLSLRWKFSFSVQIKKMGVETFNKYFVNFLVEIELWWVILKVDQYQSILLLFQTIFLYSSNILYHYDGRWLKYF